MAQRPLGTITAAVALVCTAVVPALARQPGRFYVGAGVGTFRLSADAVEGSSAAPAVVAGFGVLPWLDVEAEFMVPSDVFRRSYGGDALSLSFAPAGSPVEERERLGIWLRYDKQRDVSVSISTVAIFHPAARMRVTPGFVIGVTNHRVTDRTDYTPVKVGAGVAPDYPYAVPHAERAGRTLGALTVGANLSVAVTRGLAIVPDVRYDYGSIGDEINNAWRSSVRVIWRF
jgi:hypothetical protein